MGVEVGLGGGGGGELGGGEDGWGEGIVNLGWDRMG